MDVFIKIWKKERKKMWYMAETDKTRAGQYIAYSQYIHDTFSAIFELQLWISSTCWIVIK